MFDKTKWTLGVMWDAQMERQPKWVRKYVRLVYFRSLETDRGYREEIIHVQTECS